MMENTPTIKGLYAVTPDEADTKRLLRQIELLNQGGCHLLQYRNKSLPFLDQMEQAEQVKRLCEELKITLIINDNVDICCNLDADGVHLGENDDKIETAREKIGPKKYIGLSCYNSLERVNLAIKKKVDYIALGSFFETKTKPNAPRVTLETLRQVKKICSLPVVAIGGITLDNVSCLVKEQVDAVAIVNGLFKADDIALSAKNFIKLFS